MNGDSLMPQILKDDVRDKIVETARNLFITRGYDRVSMNLIAREAGVAVGNIYRYFNGKNILYRHIAGPVIDKLMDLFNEPVKSDAFGEVEMKIKKFIGIYESEKRLLFLLLENSQNSDFQSLKDDIIDSFTKAVSRWNDSFPELSKEYFNNSFVRAFTCAYVNGIISILAEDTDEDIKKAGLYKFSSFMKNSLYREYKSAEDENE